MSVCTVHNVASLTTTSHKPFTVHSEGANPVYPMSCGDESLTRIEGYRSHIKELQKLIKDNQTMSDACIDSLRKSMRQLDEMIREQYRMLVDIQTFIPKDV